MLGILDFDGTIVDSYTIIPSIYKKIQEELKIDGGFVNAMLMVEELGDYFGIFEREKFLRLVLKDQWEYVLEIYWKLRTENQILLSDAIKFLERYSKTLDLYLVTSKDDTIDMKKERIKKVGIKKYFKDIIIYGERDFEDLNKALEYLYDIEKECFYIDDKNINLSKIKIDIKLFKKIFYPPYPLKLAWNYPEVEYPKILNLLEIEKYISIYT